MNEDIKTFILAVLLVITIIYITTPSGCKYADEGFAGNVVKCSPQDNCNQVTGFDHNEIKDDVEENNEDNKKLEPMCSPACCHPQYPPPFRVYDNEVDADYIKTGTTCNNSWQSTGCLCMTKDYQKYLESRGNNI